MSTVGSLDGGIVIRTGNELRLDPFSCPTAALCSAAVVFFVPILRFAYITVLHLTGGSEC